MHWFWLACMATGVARSSFSPAGAVWIVLVAVRGSCRIWSLQCGVSFMHVSESALLSLQDAIFCYMLAGLSEP